MSAKVKHVYISIVQVIWCMVLQKIIQIKYKCIIVT